MEFTYSAPSTVLFGKDSSRKIGSLIQEFGCKKVLCVHGKIVKKTGIIDPIVKLMEQAGISVVEYDEVVPDPPIEVAEKGAVFAKKENVDGILAVGGGSAIDTAKAINILLGNEGDLRQYIGLNMVKKKGVPLIIIPTTAGTGSEVTSATVVSDTKHNKKVFCSGPNIAGDLAVLDPELTMSMPKSTTAATGMDAMSHVVEAVTGVLANPLTDAIAYESIRLIHQNLIPAYETGNPEARTSMMLGSMMAGIAFSNSYPHLGHSLAHVLGARFHIAHGNACAMVLPDVIEFVGGACIPKVRRIGEAMELPIADDSCDAAVIRMVADELRRMNERLGIPKLRELGITEQDLGEVKKAVMEEFLIALTPRPVTEEDVKELLEKVYNS